MLKRKFYDTLGAWKASKNKKALLVKGARQIGKTYIIDRFGRDNYEQYLYLNFIDNERYREVFAGSIEASDIFSKLSSMILDFKVIPGKTLIFMDEIQNCPRARMAFKPLVIDGRVDVIASGSLLGLTFLNDSYKHEREALSVPVGYEHQETMHSLDFEEYLWAVGCSPEKIDELRRAFVDRKPLPTFTNTLFEERFREYIAVGGMPEVVTGFLAEKNYSTAFRTQEEIVRSNLDDIAKYAPTVDKPKIRSCYLSMPRHLARENTKFKYSLIESGGSFRKFGNSIDWLCEASIAHRCFNLEQPVLPLSVYHKPECFKLYSSDIGLLTAMMGFSVKRNIVEDTLEKFAKGGLYENAIFCQLVRNGYAPSYFMPKANVSEIDFFIEKEGAVIPIEVKSRRGTSTSFDGQLERATIPFGYKFTSGNIGQVGKKITLPHYMSIFV